MSSVNMIRGFEMVCGCVWVSECVRVLVLSTVQYLMWFGEGKIVGQGRADTI